MKNLRLHRCDACKKLFNCYLCPHRLRGGEFLPESIYCKTACRLAAIRNGHGRKRAGSRYRAKVADLEARNALMAARDLYLKNQPRTIGG